MYDGDGRYDLDDRPLGKWIALTVVVGVVAAMGFTMVRDQQSRTMRASALAIETTAAVDRVASGSSADDTSSTTTVPAPSTLPRVEPDDRRAGGTVSTTIVVRPPSAADAPAPSSPSTPAATPASAATRPQDAEAPSAQLGYPAAPDGSPLPVIVSYDSGTVTLTGAVPSHDDRVRLVGLAQANSQAPDVDVIDNLFVNPAVPASVGVRVIEMDSARFGEGEAQLAPEHTMQFDRVAAVLRALPHVSVLVIGHADQRGDDHRNRELSENRASTVVDYLTYLGIEPTRLSMRGAGETDLLTLDSDRSALALNRRTEFVFYGVLV